ncbi:MAG: hypothetical protein Q9163_003427 [Psora crenata]
MKLSPSLLLCLPGEVRMKIYEYTVASDDAYIYPCKLRNRLRSRLPKTDSFLCVCRQIRIEATNLYYNLNVFRFTSAAVMHDFLASLTPIAAGALREIFCEFNILGEHPRDRCKRNAPWKCFGRLTGLRKLTFRDAASSVTIKAKRPNSDVRAEPWLQMLPSWLDEVIVIGSKAAAPFPAGDFDYCEGSDDGLTEFERRQLEGARLEGAQRAGHASEW